MVNTMMISQSRRCYCSRGFSVSFEEHLSYLGTGDIENEVLSIPGTVFTGDTDLWKNRLAWNFRVKKNS